MIERIKKKIIEVGQASKDNNPTRPSELAVEIAVLNFTYAEGKSLAWRGAREIEAEYKKTSNSKYLELREKGRTIEDAKRKAYMETRDMRKDMINADGTVMEYEQNLIAISKVMDAISQRLNQFAREAKY